MKEFIGYIETCPQNFKVCKDCRAINWYEKEQCHQCGSEKFLKSEKEVKKWLEAERDFWKNTEKLDEEIIDDVCIEC